MKTDKQQAAAAAAFAQRWKGRGYEKGDSQVFWTELLTEVFGVENPSTIIRYEEQVKVDNTNFIDGHIPSTKVYNHYGRLLPTRYGKSAQRFATPRRSVHWRWILSF